MEIKKQLEEIIYNSPLGEVDKEIWKEFVDGVTESNLAPILELLRDNPENIHLLTKNLQEKFLAIKTSRKAVLEEILKSEKETLLGGLE